MTMNKEEEVDMPNLETFLPPDFGEDDYDLLGDGYTFHLEDIVIFKSVKKMLLPLPPPIKLKILQYHEVKLIFDYNKFDFKRLMKECWGVFVQRFNQRRVRFLFSSVCLWFCGFRFTELPLKSEKFTRFRFYYCKNFKGNVTLPEMTHRFVHDGESYEGKAIQPNMVKDIIMYCPKCEGKTGQPKLVFYKLKDCDLFSGNRAIHPRLIIYCISFCPLFKGNIVQKLMTRYSIEHCIKFEGSVVQPSLVDLSVRYCESWNDTIKHPKLVKMDIRKYEDDLNDNYDEILFLSPNMPHLEAIYQRVNCERNIPQSITTYNPTQYVFE